MAMLHILSNYDKRLKKSDQKIMRTNPNTIEMLQHRICHNTTLALSYICNNESECFSKVVSDHHLVNFYFVCYRKSLLSLVSSLFERLY